MIDSFDFTQRDIQRFGNAEVFWEEKTGSKVPIREPKITRLIGSFLVGEGATRNFDVTIETAAGGGIVDFYVAAPVEGVGIAKIAVEAKKAESSDLVRGLSKQLPDYMNKIGTRYGIYVVYWLKSFDYPKPHFESYAKLETEKLHPIKRAEQIRTLCLDLSRDTKPSKR